MVTFVVEVIETTYYYVDAATEEDAKDIALEYKLDYNADDVVDGRGGIEIGEVYQPKGPRGSKA
jgi:hypothetical protein